MPNITSFEILENAIDKLEGKPIVLEALWDGDTQGWFLYLSVYTEIGLSPNQRITKHGLGHISLGTDFRVFVGGEWTETFLAKELGEKAIEKYGLEFYFPSDNEPDDDCPAWTDRHLAIHCADCNKLIIPTSSPYSPKDICYHCHLARERNAKIKEAHPNDGGVNMYLYKDGVFHNIGYCTDFKSFAIAPFIQQKVEKQLKGLGIEAVTLEEHDILELKTDLEVSLEQKLQQYQKPILDEFRKKLIKTYFIEHQGKKYELADRFHSEHDQIARLLSSLETAQRAISEKFVYKIYFKNGMTYRDDSFLRFINFVCKGSANTDTIVEYYKNILTKDEILETLSKLEQMGCIILNSQIISITEIGQHIL